MVRFHPEGEMNYPQEPDPLGAVVFYSAAALTFVLLAVLIGSAWCWS